MPIHRGKMTATAEEKDRDTWVEGMVLGKGWETRVETCAEAEAKEPGKDLGLAQCTSAEEMPRDTCCSDSLQQLAQNRVWVLANSKAVC